MICNCPECQQPIDAPDDMAGQQAQCPFCEQIIVIPAGNASAVSQGAVCSSCGSAMEPDAVLCVQCGYHSVLGKKIETEM